jgi:hypothetical protein
MSCKLALSVFVALKKRMSTEIFLIYSITIFQFDTLQALFKRRGFGILCACLFFLKKMAKWIYIAKLKGI